MPAVCCHGPKKDLWVSPGRCCHCFSLRALQAAPGNILNSTSNFNLKFEKGGGNDKMSKSLNPASGACKCTQSGLLWAGGTFLVFFDCWKWLYTIKGTLKDVGRAQRGCCVSIRNLQIWPASLGSKVRWKAFQSIFLRSNRLQNNAYKRPILGKKLCANT